MHFSGSHAHLYAGTAPYHVMYSKTFSILAYQMELDTSRSDTLTARLNDTLTARLSDTLTARILQW